ncbi:hypothetical protein DSECCO2_497920 [anaerobic digester metagenome]
MKYDLSHLSVPRPDVKNAGIRNGAVGNDRSPYSVRVPAVIVIRVGERKPVLHRATLFGGISKRLDEPGIRVQQRTLGVDDGTRKWGEFDDLSKPPLPFLEVTFSSLPVGDILDDTGDAGRTVVEDRRNQAHEEESNCIGWSHFELELDLTLGPGLEHPAPDPRV